MITINELVGEWSLVKFTLEKHSDLKEQWGENPHGILIYTRNGYMSVSINSTICDAALRCEDKFKSILFYAGTYEIIHNNKITHQVMNASDDNRIGNKLIRDALIENQQLTLTGKGDFGTATLIWKKIPELNLN